MRRLLRFNNALMIRVYRDYLPKRELDTYIHIIIVLVLYLS